MSVTIGAALRQAVRCLQQAGVSEPRASAEVLLADLLSISRPRLYLESGRPLSYAHYRLYTHRLQRRQHGEPVQYITGHQEFWSRDFEVNAQVLIPRPESELLVECGAELMRRWERSGRERPCVLDIGTGSGNLAISLAHELPQASVWAIDRSMAALRVAQGNARQHEVADRLIWWCGDLVTALHPQLCRFALCVSNLPYISRAEWPSVSPEVRDYEPREALCGGEDGLALIRRLITAAPGVLAPGGSLLLEVGWKQAQAVVEGMRQAETFCRIEAYRDLAGIERVVWGQVP
jgi:release factor glutamine methyltransferase